MLEECMCINIRPMPLSNSMSMEFLTQPTDLGVNLLMVKAEPTDQGLEKHLDDRKPLARIDHKCLKELFWFIKGMLDDIAS